MPAQVAQETDLPEDWAYEYCAAYDITALDPPVGGKSHTIDAMPVKVSSANQEYINKLFRMKDYSSNVQFTSTTQNNPVRDLVRTIGTGTPEAQRQASDTLAHLLAEATPANAPKGLFVVLVGKHGKSQRVALWRFPNQTKLAVVKEGQAFAFKVTKAFSGDEVDSFKAACFDGTAAPNAMWKGRVKDVQTANQGFDIAKYWLEKFLQCERTLKPQYGTVMVMQGMKKALEKAKTPELKEHVESAITVLKTQDGKTKTVREIAEDLLPEESRAEFLKGTKLAQSDLDKQFQVNAEQIKTEYKFRYLRFADDTTVKGRKEAFEEKRIKEEKLTNGETRVTITGKVTKARMQAR